MTVAFAAGLLILYEIRRILLWLFIALFVAAVIGPAVSFLVRRGWRRGLAIGAVVVILTLLAGGAGYVLVRPLVTQSIEFAEDLPENLDRLQKAPIVRQTLDRFNVEDRLEQVSADLPDRLLGFSGPLFSIFKTIGEAIIALVSIAVMTVFLLLYGPQFAETALRLIPDGRLRQRVDSLGVKSLGAVSGWVLGNVLTSVVAGVAALALFVSLGLPYATLLALWVAIADLIPLAGDARCDPRDRRWLPRLPARRDRRHRLLHPLPAARESRAAACRVWTHHQTESVPRLARHPRGHRARRLRGCASGPAGCGDNPDSRPRRPRDERPPNSSGGGTIASPRVVK